MNVNVELHKLVRYLIELHGSANAVARLADVECRTVERALRPGARVNARTRERLQAVALGQRFDAARAARVAEYARRVELYGGVFERPKGAKPLHSTCRSDPTTCDARAHLPHADGTD